MPAILLVWLFLWQLGSLLLGQEILLVSPIKIGRNLAETHVDTRFFGIVLVLPYCGLWAAFLLALLTGSVLAFCGWRVPFIHEFFKPLIECDESNAGGIVYHLGIVFG